MFIIYYLLVVLHKCDIFSRDGGGGREEVGGEGNQGRIHNFIKDVCGTGLLKPTPM